MKIATTYFPNIPVSLEYKRQKKVDAQSDFLCVSKRFTLQKSSERLAHDLDIQAVAADRDIHVLI